MARVWSLKLEKYINDNKHPTPKGLNHRIPGYRNIKSIPTVLTIHNAQYQGWMDWADSKMIPAWDTWSWGMLDWANKINPLASAIKCADKVTTVSPSYLDELKYMSNGLEDLFEYEKGKCVGIINGIDADVWDPATDTYLQNHYSIKDAEAGKLKSKLDLCETFNLDPEKPLIVFHRSFSRRNILTITNTQPRRG